MTINYSYVVNLLASYKYIDTCFGLPSMRSLGLHSDGGKIRSSREKSTDRPTNIRGLTNNSLHDGDKLELL